MNMKTPPNEIWEPAFANDFDTDNRAFVPEVWANESLIVLEENLVAGNLVHRDFENEIKQFGDIVNTRRPGKFYARRKVDADAITVQPATADKVQIPLNQHLHTSFIIYDGEQSKSMKDLVSLYLVPAVKSIAYGIDSVVLGQRYQFLANVVGKLGTALSKATIIALQTKMNNLLIPQDGRVAIVTAAGQGDLLGEAQFSDADKFGDGGSAIRNGSIGRLYGTQFVMSQNSRTFAASENTTRAAAINLSAGYAAGSTAVVIDGISGAIVNGSWCTVAGDMTPQLITGSTGGSVPTALTLSPGLRNAVVNDAVITIYSPGAINLTAGYAAGYGKFITIDGFSDTKGPQEGQLVSIGATSAAEIHSSLALGLDETTNIAYDRDVKMLLDTPLVATAANNAIVGIGPAGNYNFAFHRNAIALVSRPLALPPAALGARAAVVNYNGFSIRVVMSYDTTYQGIKVTVDTLCGVQTLDANLGVLLLS